MVTLGDSTTVVPDTSDSPDTADFPDTADSPDADAGSCDLPRGVMGLDTTGAVMTGICWYWRAGRSFLTCRPENALALVDRDLASSMTESLACSNTDCNGEGGRGGEGGREEVRVN